MGKPRIIAGIYGAGGAGAGDNPTLKALVTGLGGKMFKAGQRGKIIDYLDGGTAAGKDIIILGYSRGGNAGVGIANALGKRGIAVSRLITFDPHSLSDHRTFQLRYDNVDEAYNFYQRNPRTAGRFGWWGGNPYWGSPVFSPFKPVRQTDFTGAGGLGGVAVSHLNIIRHSVSVLIDKGRSV